MDKNNCLIRLPIEIPDGGTLHLRVLVIKDYSIVQKEQLVV